MGTKTKTKTKTAPKPGVLQLPPKIGKRQSTKATLLVKRVIKCNGHLHEIGLSSKGQLWIPRHKKDELERYIMMGDLGNNPCKCAVVLDAWRREHITTQIHPEFQREYVVRSRLARRLVKRLNKHRHWPNIDIIYDELCEPHIRSEKYSHGGTYEREITALMCMARFVTGTIYKTLIHRGWRKELLDLSDVGTTIHMNDCSHPTGMQRYTHNYAQLFQAHIGGHHCITPYVGGELIVDSTVHENEKVENIPWRTFIDAAETRLVYLLSYTAGKNRYDTRVKKFEELANQRILAMGDLPEHSNILVQQENGTVTLKIEHPGLTVQAANRLVKYYRDSQDTVKRLLQHNRKRRKLWFRTPAKPSRGFGFLAREKSEPVAIRPVEGESYGIGLA